MKLGPATLHKRVAYKNTSDRSKTLSIVSSSHALKVKNDRLEFKPNESKYLHLSFQMDTLGSELAYLTVVDEGTSKVEECIKITIIRSV